MNVLVIGSGGREHALTWKIKQSPRVQKVFVAPGNAGTASDAENIDIDPLNFAALASFARQHAVDLTVVGPEAPLCAGIVDHFQQERLKIFGPTRAAAQLEGSKVFCKQLLRSAGVPTADFWVFHKPAAAFEFVEERFGETPMDVPLVVKTDGLAAGKGALVCFTMEEVKKAIRRIAIDREFGDAGNRFLIEARLSGPEVSLMAITDGQTILMLPPAQDYKRAYDGDRGPNTGGMGAYCPAPVIDEETIAWAGENVFVPTIHAMKRARMPFQGILYAGLMLTPQGPKVLEYNVRFGDPECQPLLMRLQTDLVDILELVLAGRLAELQDVAWDPRPAICVVMAAEGYPNDYRKGDTIRGLETAAALPDTKVFHAGTKLVNGQAVTSGGRVLGVTALGSSVANAKLNAYTAVKEIRWQGAWCRKDISDGSLPIAVKS